MNTSKYNPILHVMPATEHGKEITFRSAGDQWLLVEYGPMELDYMDMFRVQAVVAEIRNREIKGLIEEMYSFRTVSYHFDPRTVSMKEMLDIAIGVEKTAGDNRDLAKLEFDSPIIEMPICFEDTETKKAVEKYLREIKPVSVDCDPKHLSCMTYVANYNGLTRDEFKEKFLTPEWFIFSMGFFPGLAIFVPVDRRCTLRTSKSNPPRTWTPRNEVGMGSFITCIYSEPGPGGYHIFGRSGTIFQVAQEHPNFKNDMLLLGVQMRIRFFEVDEEELNRMTNLIDTYSPEFVYKITPGTFSVPEWLDFQREHQGEIEAHLRRIDEAASKAPVP